MQKTVKVNANGLRVGEDHPRAKLTDREVDRMRELHEEGVTITELSRMFEMSKGSVHDIVNCRRRAETVVGERVVRVPD